MSTLQVNKITPQAYTAVRNRNKLAETKYGFVVDENGIKIAYIKDGTNYYAGELLISETDFQMSALGEVTQITFVELIAPPDNEKSAA